MADNKAASSTTGKPSFFKRAAGAVKKFFLNIGKFFKDTKSELKKVVWPGKDEVRTSTITVVVVVLIAAAFMILLDLLFGGVIHLLIGA